MNSENKKFWLNYAKKLSWKKFPSTAFRQILSKPDWFFDGRINIYENCVERHINEGNGDKIAIHYIKKNGKISNHTYQETSILVSKFSEFLKSQIKEKNQKIMIHASASLDTTIAILSCAKLGLHFSVIFEELKDEALYKRIKIFKPNIIFSKKINTNIKKLFKEITQFKIDKYKELKLKNIKDKFKFFKSNRPLFTLFTSGSTGMPKGITHGSGGYLLYSYYTCEKYFGLNKNSKILTASDAGWINGHTYAIFGPLSIGASTVIIEKPTMLMNKNILIAAIDLKITVLYIPVTLLRLMKSIYSNTKFESKNIKTLGSMGEPLANSVGRWFVKTFGKKNMPIINTYFQTETGGIITSHKYNDKVSPNLYGCVGVPIKNHIKLNKLSKKKKEIKIQGSWPGQMIDVINSKDHWKKYFDLKGNFRMFDYATMNKKNILIHGRTDDVINIRGHRVGSSEIESIVLEIRSNVECSAISVENEIEGNVFYLFCISKKKNINEIEQKIIKNFGVYAVPKKIFFIKELPKTRSGKIMRRILRDLINNPKKKIISDISTLTNKKVIKDISNIILSS